MGFICCITPCSCRWVINPPFAGSGIHGCICTQQFCPDSGTSQGPYTSLHQTCKYCYLMYSQRQEETSFAYIKKKYSEVFKNRHFRCKSVKWNYLQIENLKLPVAADTEDLKSLCSFMYCYFFSKPATEMAGVWKESMLALIVYS